MKSALRARSLTFAALSVVATAVALAAQAPAPKAAGVHLGPPPPGSWRLCAPSVVACDAQFQARVALACDERKVRVAWRYSAAGNFQLPDLSITEEFALGWWPTACEAVAPNRIVVSGKRRSGETRIERWTLKKPLLVAGSGSAPARLTLQGLADVTEVYDDAIAGRDIVRGMIRKRGAEDRVYVQFHDSRDLYVLDVSAEPYPLVLELSHVAEPGLKAEFDHYQGGDHQQHGYVYMFGSVDRPETTPALVLKDTDRNGTIDWHGVMSAEAWAQSGLEHLSNYVEYGGGRR